MSTASKTRQLMKQSKRFSPVIINKQNGRSNTMAQKTKRTTGTNKKAEKTYIGYTKSELATLSVYELREISALMEETMGEKHYRFTHFFKKDELLKYITGSKAMRKAMRDERTAALSKSLGGTALNARKAKKQQMIKSLELRLKAIGKPTTKEKAAKVKETKARIAKIEQEIAEMSN